MNASTPSGLRGAPDALRRLAPWLGRWLAACIVLPILGFGLLKAWPGLLGAARHLSTTGLHATAALAALLALAAAAWLARRRAPLPVAGFVLATTVAGACLRYIYAASVEPEWTSDFLTYWVAATEQVASGDFGAHSLYTERTLPVLVPLIGLFGPDKAHVALANVAMLAFVQLAGYDILRRLHSHQAAQAFTAAFLAAPIPYFASTIPSHDLWAMWLLSIALWIAAVGLGWKSRHWKVLCAAGVLPLALACLLLEIQRGVGTLLAASLALSAAIGWLVARRGTAAGGDARSGPFALACLAVFALQAPLGALAGRMELRAAQSPAHQAYLSAYYAANGTSLGNGTWGWMRDFRENFTDRLEAKDPDRLQAFSRSIILSDWAEQPGKRIGNAAGRMRGLFILDDSNYWYFAGTAPALEGSLAWLRAYSGWFSLGFASLLLLAMARMLLGTFPSTPVLCGLVFTSLVALALATFSENQPRYLLWLWFTGPLFVADVLGRRHDPAPLSARQAAWMALAVATGWLLLLLVLWLPARTLYGDADGRILGQWTYPATGRPTGEFPPLGSTAPYVHATDPGRLAVVLYPDGRRVVQRRVCLGDEGAWDLAFHVRAHGAAPDNTLRVRYGKRDLRSVPLAAATAKTREVRIPDIGAAGSCDLLAFGIDASAEARVDLYFVRLERRPDADGDRE